jgi:hypothetical protein
MMPPIRTRRQGSCQASAKHFSNGTKFPLLRNRRLGALAVTALGTQLGQWEFDVRQRHTPCYVPLRISQVWGLSS